MKTLKIFTTFLAAAILFISCDKNNDETVNTADQNFLVQASISNTAERAAATLALSKATRVEVKAFAQQMLTEHTAAQSDLISLSASVGYPVRDTLDAAHLAMMSTLNSLSGRAFDSIYIYAQVADHQTTQLMFETEIRNGQHASVRNYASDYLPHIRQHYVRADSIARALFPR